MIVVDSSVMVDAVSDHRSAPALRRLLATENLVAPDYLPIEVTSAVRGLRLSQQMTRDDAIQAVRHFQRMQVGLQPSSPLLLRTLELSDNLSAYDAGYVALAEAFGCRLLTYDRRLAAAPGVRCRIEVPAA